MKRKKTVHQLELISLPLEEKKKEGNGKPPSPKPTPVKKTAKGKLVSLSSPPSRPRDGKKKRFKGRVSAGETVLISPFEIFLHPEVERLFFPHLKGVKKEYRVDPVLFDLLLKRVEIEVALKEGRYILFRGLPDYLFLQAHPERLRSDKTSLQLKVKVVGGEIEDEAFIKEAFYDFARHAFLSLEKEVLSGLIEALPKRRPFSKSRLCSLARISPPAHFNHTRTMPKVCSKCEERISHVGERRDGQKGTRVFCPNGCLETFIPKKLTEKKMRRYIYYLERTCPKCGVVPISYSAEGGKRRHVCRCPES